MRMVLSQSYCRTDPWGVMQIPWPKGILTPKQVQMQGPCSPEAASKQALPLATKEAFHTQNYEIHWRFIHTPYQYRVTLKKLSSILFLIYLHYVQIKKGHSSFSTYKPLKRGDIYEGVTSIKAKSTNKGIYSVQYLKKNDEYTSPQGFRSTFYSTTNLGEKRGGE